MMDIHVIPKPNINGYMDVGLTKFDIVPSGGGIAEMSSRFCWVTMMDHNQVENLTEVTECLETNRAGSV